MIKKSYILIAFLGNGLWGVPQINLFKPYDILLVPRLSPNVCFDASITYEGTLSTHGVQEKDPRTDPTFSKKVNVLQLWQDTQDALAALKGTCSISDASILADLFALNDDNGAHGRFCVTGDLNAHNILLAARYRFPHNLTLAFYLPIIQMELKNVCWRELNACVDGSETTPNTTREDLLGTDLLCKVAKLGCLSLGGWRRTGPGDLAALVWWYRDFPQARPLLCNVRTRLRGGIIFPTGLKENEDILLGMPFGYNASGGFLFGGTLELWVTPWSRFGIDAEFTGLFGSFKQRRIKTDPAQTDHLFIHQLRTYLDPGFNQHYTLWWEYVRIFHNIGGRIAYQFIKHAEDEIFICNDCFSSTVANNAESLQDWTLHSIIFQISYDSSDNDGSSWWNPYISAFFKLGFNGKRAIAANTLGLQVDFSF